MDLCDSGLPSRDRDTMGGHVFLYAIKPEKVTGASDVIVSDVVAEATPSHPD
jgi:hypothetical protein